jgi:hypothetical protein
MTELLSEFGIKTFPGKLAKRLFFEHKQTELIYGQ